MASEIKVDTIVNAGGDNDSGIDLATNDNIKFNIAGSQKAIIESNGRLGIGTSSPSRTLHVNSGSTNTGAEFQSTDTTSSIKFTDNSGTAEIGNTGDALVFFPAGAEKMRIDSSGNLLKNTTSTISTGSASDTGIQLGANNQAIFIASGGPAVLIARQGGTGEAVRFGNQGTGDVGSIDVTTSSTNYSQSSDYRLKENVVTDWDATARLKQLKPSRFNFKVDKDTTVDGFLAHEVSSIVPEAITGEKDAVDKDGNIDPQGIDQSKLVPLLTKALQEAISEIDTLKEKVTALESK